MICWLSIKKRTSNFRFSSKYRFRNTLILSEVATLTSFQNSCYFDVFLKEQNQYYRRKIFNKFQLVSRFIKACLRAFQIGTNCPKLWDYIGYYYLNVTRFMNLLHREDSWRFMKIQSNSETYNPRLILIDSKGCPIKPFRIYYNKIRLFLDIYRRLQIR